ncbi:hypothetical protein BLGI_4174 [Brevibacillus laterosporus GI-9]|nr:hypothetical protein BLGI_4174 [Brevibacillus laterosporus GI-9]
MVYKNQKEKSKFCKKDYGEKLPLQVKDLGAVFLLLYG